VILTSCGLNLPCEHDQRADMASPSISSAQTHSHQHERSREAGQIFPLGSPRFLEQVKKSVFVFLVQTKTVQLALELVGV